MIRALFTSLFWITYLFIGALISFPVTLITRRIDFLWRIAIFGSRAGVRLAGVKVEVKGRENIDPAQPYLFMANHVSNIDPPLLVPQLERQITVLAKIELFRIPIFGTAMRLGGFVPVDRRNREAAIESVREAVRGLQAGRSMLVYPEGTRSPDGKLLPFKKGPFHLAMDAGIPILPITMVGLYETWPKGKFKITPGTVTVIFHKPIDPKQFADRDALLFAVRAAIEGSLPEKYRSA